MASRNNGFIAGGIIILLLLTGGYSYMSNEKSYASITTFEECKQAGYPIMESYPEQCRTPDGRVFVRSVSVATTTAEHSFVGKPGSLEIYNIIQGQTVQSPLTIEGTARLWYFEASFPVELRDGNGKILAQGPATAQGDWMTTNFVPFKITLTFAKPTTATGTLIFRKDNPSGEPALDESFSLPVRFSGNERIIKLYYYNSARDKDSYGTILCSAQGLVPVNRTIPLTQTPLTDTINLFLKGGLTSEEKNQGLTTEYPLPGVTLTGATISRGTATITLTDPNITTSGGACRAAILKAQLEATALQFPEVTSVVFKPDTLFQP